MIDTVTGWDKMMQYSNKRAMNIKNLTETTWLVRYPWTVEITYDGGGEFIGHKFKSILIENEYGINTKPASPGNTQASKTIEIIYKVLGKLVSTFNIQETYLDADQWLGILAASTFAVQSTYHRTKDKIPCQMVFGRDMILKINLIADWRYIHQSKKTKINKDFICEKSTRIDHNYRVGDKVMQKKLHITTKTYSEARRKIFRCGKTEQ